MFRLDRLLGFVRAVLRAVVPSLVVVLVLSFLTQILARANKLPEALVTWEFWVRVALGIVPLLLAIGSAFLLAARFLKAVYPRLRTREAINFIIYSRLGRPTFGPWMKIQGGKVTMPDDSVLTRIGGPGALIVGGDNAVVLERAGTFTSVQGPGFPRLEPFERVYDTLDLGPKRTCYTVQAMSREGILIDWTVEVQYQLADGGQSLPNGAFYPLSPDDVFRASTCKWIREESWKFGQDMDWEGLIVISQAEGTLRSILARRPLDELIGLTEGDAQAVRIAIQQDLEKDLQTYAPKVGAKILHVRLDNLRVRDEVAQQWIETWKARWQSWAAERLGHGEAANIFQYERAKADAQAEMILDISQALRTFLGNPSFPRQAIPQMLLLRLFSVLDRADFAKSSRVFFPTQTLEALEAIRQPVQGGFQPIVTALVANPSSIRVADSTTILATLGDGAGNAVPDGTEVVFGTSAGSLSTVSARSMGSVAQTTLTAGSTAGEAQIWARVAGASASMTVRFLPGPPSDVSLLINPLSTDAGGEVELYADARDAFGNPIADGTPVLFRTTLGSLSISSVEARQGRAQSRLAADGKVGQANVTVQVGTESAWQQVSFVPGTSHSLALAADSLEAEVGQEIQIQATVVDAWGNPVADGTTVTFQSSRGSIPAVLSSTVGGQATALLVAGPSPGLLKITARSMKSSDAVDLQVSPGPPDLLNLAAREASIEVGSQTELFVLVQDASGNPVADGTEVRFAVTQGKVWPPVTQCKSGLAQAVLAAPNLPVRARVSASAGRAQHAVAVDFVPGPPNTIELVASSGSVRCDEGIDVLVLVQDAKGNPVTDRTSVILEGDLARPDPSIVQTMDGEATFRFIAGSQPGTASLTARVGSIRASQLITVV